MRLTVEIGSTQLSLRELLIDADGGAAPRAHADDHGHVHAASVTATSVGCVDPGALLIDLLDRLHPNRAGKAVVDRATAARIRAAHRAASADRKSDEDAVDAAKAEMVALLADAAYAVDADGNTLASYKPDQRNSVDLKLLEAKYPAVYAEVVTRKPTAPILRWTKELS